LKGGVLVKVVYRNITEDLLYIWVYADYEKTFVANVAVKKATSRKKPEGVQVKEQP
jgi:hypothetical protein